MKCYLRLIDSLFWNMCCLFNIKINWIWLWVCFDYWTWILTHDQGFFVWYVYKSKYVKKFPTIFDRNCSATLCKNENFPVEWFLIRCNEHRINYKAFVSFVWEFTLTLLGQRHCWGWSSYSILICSRLIMFTFLRITRTNEL